jgi:N-acetylmuramoyl-L-alanine amidase
MSYRVYLAASTQAHNVGVDNYGTEEERMQFLADRVAYWLKTQISKFDVFRNKPGWSLQQTINDCNSLACNVFIDNHSNAGPASSAGTEVYYCTGSAMGKELAEHLYNTIAPISPGADRGVKEDGVLYSTGLAVLRKTTPPAALIEHFYHSNKMEVEHFINNIDRYAKAEAKAICNYFKVAWIESTINASTRNEIQEAINNAEQIIKILKKLL